MILSLYAYPTPFNEAFFLPSFNFLSSVPPTDEQKLTAGRKEKAEPPDANPRHFTERRPAGRSGVKSDFSFARRRWKKASIESRNGEMYPIMPRVAG